MAVLLLLSLAASLHPVRALSFKQLHTQFYPTIHYTTSAPDPDVSLAAYRHLWQGLALPLRTWSLLTTAL
jgi:hypothetical protein